MRMSSFQQIIIKQKLNVDQENIINTHFFFLDSWRKEHDGKTIIGLYTPLPRTLKSK